MEDKRHTILLVDDEENILNSIYRLLRREKKYEVLMAKSGAEGLEILKQRDHVGAGLAPAHEGQPQGLPLQPISLILSDQRMPVMEGVEFLARAKEMSPDTTRIMLTGYADMNAVTSAVNKGEIFRYITKPWEDEALLSVIWQGVEQYRLITERKELLELTSRQNEELKDLNQNLEKKVEERTKEVQELYKELKSSFYDTIRVFVNLVENYDSYLGGHIKRVSVFAEKFAKYLGLSDKEVEEIEIAALLHDIGLVGIPKIILAKETADLSEHEMALMKQHPAFAQSAISPIKNLHHAGVLIRSHHERYDGSGYPDGLKGEEIPYGARIIGICDTFDEIANQRSQDKGSEGAAIYFIKNNRSAVIKGDKGFIFDPQMVDSFIKFMRPEKQAELEGESEKELPLPRLREGMVVTRGVFTESGKLLVSRGSVLTGALIQRLISFDMIDPIAGNVFVRG